MKTKTTSSHTTWTHRDGHGKGQAAVPVSMTVEGYDQSVYYTIYMLSSTEGKSMEQIYQEILEVEDGS